MSKFCGKCGSKLDEETKLCPNCDKKTSFETKSKNTYQIDNRRSNNVDNVIFEREIRSTEYKVVNKTKPKTHPSGKKVKRFFLMLTVIILMLATIGGACAVVLAYFDIMDIPVVSDILEQWNKEENGIADEKEKSVTERQGASEVQMDSISDANIENDTDIYKDVLDMYYYKIESGWEGTEDISYLFDWVYSDVESLSDAGYTLIDLDENGIPELVVTSMSAAENGMIYDLYTYSNEKIIHLATSGERSRYYLCDDNTICYEGSGGALLSSHKKYIVDTNKESLILSEMVVYDGYANEENPWYYGNADCYDEEYGYDIERMTNIAETEALSTIDKYENQVISIQLNSFDRYSPYNIESQFIDEDTYNISNDVQACYNEILQEYTTKWEASGEYRYCEYVCHDVNEDGIDELIIHDGTCEGDRTHYYYTYINGDAVYLGSYDAWHTGLADGDDKLIAYDGMNGEGTYYYVTINNSVEKKEAGTYTFPPTPDFGDEIKFSSFDGVVDLSCDTIIDLSDIEDALVNYIWENNIQDINTYQFYSDGTGEENDGSRTFKYELDGTSLHMTFDTGWTVDLELVYPTDDINWDIGLTLNIEKIPDNQAFFYETDWVDGEHIYGNAMYILPTSRISSELE